MYWYRRTASDNTELGDSPIDLNLGDFAEAIEEYQVQRVIDDIFKEMIMEDWEGAWGRFLENLEWDFDAFYEGSPMGVTVTRMCLTVQNGNLYYDTRDALWKKVKDYAAAKLHDVFVNILAAYAGGDYDYKGHGNAFLDQLYGVFKGKKITCYFNVEAGEIR
jgi:hypothetical protein